MNLALGENFFSVIFSGIMEVIWPDFCAGRPALVEREGIAELRQERALPGPAELRITFPFVRLELF